MKIWPWGSDPDYSIRVEQGTKGKGRWRWLLSFQGDTVAVAPRAGLGDCRGRADSLPQDA